MQQPSNLDVHVVPGDGVPIYRQIVRQIGDAVATGRLAPGDRLPSQRELASRLVVAPLTVKKAYDLLEQQGVVELRHGSGTFVAQGAGRDDAAAHERLAQGARQLAAAAALAGLDDEALLQLVREAAARLRAERAAPPPNTEDEEDTP